MIIDPVYVTFEQAKLLTEKGFYLHKEEGFYESCPAVFLNDKSLYVKYNSVLGVNKWELYNAPEQWQVVEWLRLNHEIWIEVRHIKTFGINRFHLIIWNYKNTEDYITIHSENGVGYKVWDAPQEATSAAIDFVLKNLI